MRFTIEFKGNKHLVEADHVINVHEAMDFLESQGIVLADRKLCQMYITIEMVNTSSQLGTLLSFPTHAYMQIDDVAIQTHLDNLINTFGRERVQTAIGLIFAETKAG